MAAVSLLPNFRSLGNFNVVFSIQKDVDLLNNTVQLDSNLTNNKVDV